LFIDNLFLNWTGPAAVTVTVVCDFRHALLALAIADEAIGLDWRWH
jgi:hypothetical protein